jgi:hypothetical protein
MAAVYGLILRLKPQAQSVRHIKQGSNDPKNPWARAQLGWIMQLVAIRFGLILFYGPFLENENTILTSTVSHLCQ